MNARRRNVSAHTVTGNGTAAVIGTATAGGIEETRGTVGAGGQKEAEGPGAEARIEIVRIDAEVDRTAGTPAHAHAPATVPGIGIDRAIASPRAGAENEDPKIAT